MSLLNYHKSTTKELLALTDKVRDLITHWGEDGRYKEAVLKNVIRRFLPEKFMIGTGFVIRQTANRGDHESSRQIDLIIYDNASPVLFKEGDFVILTPDAVRGIIEVKANLLNQNLENIINAANENGAFIFNGKTDKNQKFFNGVFSYAGREDGFNVDTFSNNFKAGELGFTNLDNYKKFKVNHVSINKNWFVKFWPDDANPHSIYNVEDLSFSFFISNLIDAVSNKSVRKNNFIWYATDKEINNISRF
jgi:hypothetical protein